MIRKLEQKDLEAVMAIWLKGNKEAHGFVPEEYWISHYEEVKKMLPEAEVYVYEEQQGKILGFAGMTGEYLAGIFVSTETRSRGIGKQLLDFCKSVRKRLFLNVYEDNTGARHFYQREDFELQSQGTEEATGKREYVMVWKASV